MGAPAAFTKILSYYYSQRTVHYNHQQIVVENKPGKGTAQGNWMVAAQYLKLGLRC